jgi:hypothetical protein
MTTLLRTIVREYDVIEIHYNDLLNHKPYLIRVLNYDNNYPVELRLNQEEIDNLYEILKDSS